MNIWLCINGSYTTRLWRGTFILSIYFLHQVLFSLTGTLYLTILKPEADWFSLLGFGEVISSLNLSLLGGSGQEAITPLPTTDVNAIIMQLYIISEYLFVWSSTSPKPMPLYGCSAGGDCTVVIYIPRTSKMEENILKFFVWRRFWNDAHGFHVILYF